MLTTGWHPKLSTADGLRLGSTASAQEARLLQRRSYGYRADGYITTIDDHLSGLHRFDIDPAGRVHAVRGTEWTEHYAYDPAGNVTNATWPTPPQDSSLNSENQGEREYAGALIRRAGNIRYRHDAQGRVTLRQQKRLSAKPRTWHYTWDADDRLIGVATSDGARWRYQYDPLGRPVTKQRVATDGDTVAEQLDFTWDGVVLAEQIHTTGPGDTARVTAWEWGPGSVRPFTQTERAPLPDLLREWVDQQFYAIITDLVGTPTEMVESDGDLARLSRATLWGATTDSSPDGVSCPLRFPGQYHDPETGFNYNYHRYYDPNPHTYVPNPTAWLHPLGLMSCSPSDGLADLAARRAAMGAPSAGPGVSPTLE